MFVVLDLALLAPIVGMVIDTSLFCQPIGRNRLLLVLALVNQVYGYVALDTPPLRSFNPLQLTFDLPQSFRLQWSGIAVLGVAAYTIVVRLQAHSRALMIC